MNTHVLDSFIHYEESGTGLVDDRHLENTCRK